MPERILLLRGNKNRRLLPTNEISTVVGYLEAMIKLEYFSGRTEVYEIRKETDIDIVVKNESHKQIIKEHFPLNGSYTLFKIKVENAAIDLRLYEGLLNTFQLERLVLTEN
jgi:hypothetical protein